MASVVLGMQKNLDFMKYFGIIFFFKFKIACQIKRADNIYRCGWFQTA